MYSAGQELLLDLYDCRSNALNDPSALEKIAMDASRAAGFDVVEHIAHQFSHQGVTLVLILSQSHLTLHTWPEEHFASADIYVCGRKETIERGLRLARDELIAQFHPQAYSQRIIERGRESRAGLPSSVDIKDERA